MCGDRVQVFVKLRAGRHDRGNRLRGARLRDQHRLRRSDGRDGAGPQPADARALFDAFREMARTGTCPDCDADLDGPLERLQPLAGVHEYPSRVKCATLPWHALVAALDGARRRRAVNDALLTGPATHGAWTPDGETAAEAQRGRGHRRHRDGLRPGNPGEYLRTRPDLRDRHRTTTAR